MSGNKKDLHYSLYYLTSGYFMTWGLWIRAFLVFLGLAFVIGITNTLYNGILLPIVLKTITVFLITAMFIVLLRSLIKRLKWKIRNKKQTKPHLFIMNKKKRF